MKPSRLFPFLVALYPVSYLCATVTGVPPVADLISAIIMQLGLAGMAIGLAYLAWRDSQRASLAATVALLWLFAYGSVRTMLAGSVLLDGRLGREFAAIPLWTAGLMALVYLATRDRVCRFADVPRLNAFGALLLVMPLATGAIERTTGTTAPVLRLPVSTDPASVSDQSPDIYFFLMDAYGGATELSEVLSIDNHAFIRDLEARSFIVPERSYSNYPITYLSLAATMNMDYLSLATHPDGRQQLPADQSLTRAAILDSAVHAQLRAAGYRIEDLSIWTGGDAAGLCRAAASNLLLRPLAIELVNMTPLGRPVAQNLLMGLNHSASDRCRFEALPQIVATPGPKLVYLHSLITHPPYMATADGRRLPWSAIVMQRSEDRDLYATQIRFANRQLLQAIDTILSTCSRPSVIVIQGDHGPAFDLESDGGHRLRQSILNAWYLPDAKAVEHIPTSPVNTFRFLLSRYLRGFYPPIADRHFRLDGDDGLVDVTTRLTAAPAR